MNSVNRYGLVCIGGKGPGKAAIERYRNDIAFVVAADSGYHLAEELDFSPNLIVGDMDSISNFNELKRTMPEKLKTYSQEKNETDTEIGLRICREHGLQDNIIAGGGGGRLDHILALTVLFERDDRPKVWLTHREEIQAIETSVTIFGEPGQIVSFFPLGTEPCTMESLGLQWPLDGLMWTRENMGISNRLTSQKAEIQMMSGTLLIVRQLKSE
jgi:thiamine pyrophosphokinase